MNIKFILEDPHCQEGDGCSVDVRVPPNDTLRTANTKSYMWLDKNCARREVVTHTELWIDAVRTEDMGRYTCSHFSTVHSDQRDEDSVWILVGKRACWLTHSHLCISTHLTLLSVDLHMHVSVCLSVCLCVYLHALTQQDTNLTRGSGFSIAVFSTAVRRLDCNDLHQLRSYSFVCCKLFCNL